MIHSLSGGMLKEKRTFDFAKVEILDDYYSGIFWYVSNIKNLKENDVVSYKKEDDGQIKIISVNGALMFDEIKTVVGHKIAFGHNNFICTNLKATKEQLAKELATDSLVLVLPSNSLEQFKGENIICLPYSVADDQEIANNFLATVSMATYYQKSGKRIVLLVSNILLVEGALKNMAMDELSDETINYVSRFTKCGGTLIACAPEKINPDRFLIKIDNIC